MTVSPQPPWRLSRPCLDKKFLLPFLCISLLTLQFGLSLADMPVFQLEHDIICRRQSGLVGALSPEQRDQCLQSHNFQHEMRLINTGIAVSDTIVAAIGAIPLGMLSDRIGRVPILTLSVLGIVLSQMYTLFVLWRAGDDGDMVLRCLWGSGLFLVLGGGRCVAEAMVFALITDVAPLVQRSMWFQCVTAAITAARCMGPVVAGKLLRADVPAWRTLWVSLGLMLAGWLLIALFTPETLPPSDKTHVLDPAAPSSSASSPAGANRIRALLRNMRRGVVSSVRTTRLFLSKLTSSKPSMLLLPASVVVVPLATGQSDTLVRLMPILFSWTPAQSNLLLALCSFVILATLLIMTPLAFRFLDRLAPPKVGSTPPDLLLVRGTANLFAFGSFTLLMIRSSAALVTGLVLLGLAAGTPMLARSLLVTSLDADGIMVRQDGDDDGDHGSKNILGTLFGIVAFWEILAFLACQLIMNSLFDIGLRTWAALPLLFGLAVAVAVVILV